MNFDITHEGRTTLAVDYPGALALGYPAAVAGVALKGAAQAAIAATADGYRVKLAGAAPIKVAGEYWVKSQIASDQANAAAAELALIDREAAARGIDRDTLLAEIAAKATAFRQVALLVGVVEAEAKAEIAAVADDDPDAEALVEAALLAAYADLEAGVAEALAVLASV